jgi:hypothetical protein
MDSLCTALNSCVLEERVVRAWKRFYKHDTIASMRGAITPVWSLKLCAPPAYLVIDEDTLLILDDWEILGLLKENNDTNKPANCALIRHGYTNNFSLIATCDIVGGMELVYDMQKFTVV